jgi:hypothetical protein
MRVAVEPLWQARQIWRDEGYDLGGEAAERTLIAAMTGRRALDRRFVVVDLDAELRRIAKQRLKLGGNGGVIGAGESGRGQSRRRGGGKKLNDERNRDEKRGQGRTERGQAALRAPPPKRKCPAPEAHQYPPIPYSVAERMRERNFLSTMAVRPQSLRAALETGPALF